MNKKFADPDGKFDAIVLEQCKLSIELLCKIMLFSILLIRQYFDKMYFKMFKKLNLHGPVDCGQHQ